MTSTAKAAPVIPEPLQRSADDVLSGRVRIRLAGQDFVLPVLTIRQNREWVETLQAELNPLLAVEDDVAEAVALMERFSDKLLDLLYSYDRLHLLPERGDWEGDIYPHELLRAVMEVRLATDPTASYAVAALRDEVASIPATFEGLPSERTSTSRRRTAGRSRKSRTN